MTHKIDGLGGTGSTAPARAKSTEPVVSNSTGAPVDKIGAGDSIKFTGDAHYLNQLERSLSEIPDVDSKRVAKLRAAIADGSYSVNPGRIASKLMRFEWDMGVRA